MESKTLRTKQEAVEAALKRPPRRAVPQRVYYHVTEEARVPTILREGLKPSSTSLFGRHLLGVFLSASTEGALTVAEWSGVQRPYLLRVYLHPDREVYIDEVCLETCPEAEAVYVVGDISPKHVKLYGPME